MQDGDRLLVKRADGSTLVAEVDGKERRFLVMARVVPCPHDAFARGRVLTVRAASAQPAAAAGIRTEAPCGCVFVLIRDFWS